MLSLAAFPIPILHIKRRGMVRTRPCNDAFKDLTVQGSGIAPANYKTLNMIQCGMYTLQVTIDVVESLHYIVSYALKVDKNSNTFNKI